MTEYGSSINQMVGIATFSSDINSGDLRLLAYPDATLQQRLNSSIVQ